MTSLFTTFNGFIGIYGAGILAVIVALDHALAMNKNIASNSTFQLISNGMVALYSKLSGSK